MSTTSNLLPEPTHGVKYPSALLLPEIVYTQYTQQKKQKKLTTLKNKYISAQDLNKYHTLAIMFYFDQMVNIL